MARKAWYGQSIILLVLLFLACSALAVATSGSVLSRAERQAGVALPPHETPISLTGDRENTNTIAPNLDVAPAAD